VIDEGRLVEYWRVRMLDRLPVDVDDALLLLAHEQPLEANFTMVVLREVVEAEGALLLSVNRKVEVFRQIVGGCSLELYDIGVVPIEP
jgi:hypothetical protein